MTDARVLVVDDSTTMRALFCGMFERTPGLTVLDHAAGADEARAIMLRTKPDVVTLDIEMPGMNGLQFLEEIMRERPVPVIMLSTLTQKGADASIKALELGAFDCFPKPTAVTADEFNRIAPKLAALVKAAANGKPPAKKKKAAETSVDDSYRPNGRVVALSASTGGVAALMQVIPAFPALCPPTIVTLPLEPSVAEAFVARLDAGARPRIRLASDGQRLEAGNVYVAADRAHHVMIDRWPDAELRLVAKDPIAGARPSASLLFATLAKTAGAQVVAGMLTGLGNDGAAGLLALGKAGATTFVQEVDGATASEAPAAALAMGATQRALPLADIARFLLDQCGSLADAA